MNLSALDCLSDDLLSLLPRVPGVNMSGCDGARLYGYKLVTISPLLPFIFCGNIYIYVFFFVEDPVHVAPAACNIYVDVPGV